MEAGVSANGSHKSGTQQDEGKGGKLPGWDSLAAGWQYNLT